MKEIRGLDIHFPAVADQDPRRGAEQVREMVRRVADYNFNFLRPFVVGTRSQADYPSDVVPVREFPQWDPFGVLVEEARKRGMEVHPFVCVVPLGDPEATDEFSPGPLIREHPDWGMVNSRGRSTSWGNPAHPGFREYVSRVLREIIQRYQPDGISLDYARYPNADLGYSPLTREAFRKAHGVDPLEIGDDAELRERWTAFRVNLITELVGEIRTTVKEAGPDTLLSAYVWTDRDPRFCLRDWTEWLRRGYMDAINPTGYLYDEDEYRERCSSMYELAQSNSPGIPTFMNIGVHTSHGTLKDAGEVIRWSEITRENGMGMSYFTWHALEPWADTVVPALFSQPAELPWS